MLDDLLTILHTDEFEDLGSLRLVGAGSLGGNLWLKLNVFLDEDVPVSQHWEIFCRSPSEASLNPLDSFSYFEIAEDHVLLWPHTQPEVSLSFYGAVESPPAVVAALYERHRELTDGWLPFERFLNISPEYPLSRRIANCYGVLARGPTPLIAAYEEVMAVYGLKVSSIECTRPSKLWNGERSATGKWLRDNSDLAVCILGDSYVVAADFEAARLDTH